MSQRKVRATTTRGMEAKVRAPANRRATKARTAPAAMPTHRRNATAYAAWFFPLLLIGVALAAYFNSFEGAFLLDDRIRIINNPLIRQFWPQLGEMLKGLRPLLQVSLALNYAADGLDPWGYHAFNLATHALAGLLLFGIVRRMLESDSLRTRYGGSSRWLALAVAAVWLAHPLQTASVTYIIQRAESLMGLFFLLTLYCGIRTCDAPHPRRWGVAAVVACALGMGTKEVMVTAPILMWLYDRMFIASSFRDTFRQRWGLYAGLAATWLVLGLAMVINPPDEPMFIVGGLNPWSYALTQFEVIVHYLRLALWPYPLIFDYAWPIAEPLSSVVPSAVIVLALLGGTVLAIMRRAWVGFWGAWFFLILAPTSSIMPIADVAFEHRMYLSLAAVVVVAVIEAHDVLGVLARRIGVSARARGCLEASVLAAIVVTLGAATVRRNSDYRSELVMWSDTIAKRPGNPRAHLNLGNALDRLGKPNEAMAQFSEAVRLKPDYAEAHNNLGASLLDQGRLNEAVAELSESVRLNPRYEAAQNNLGAALVRQGRLDEAIKHLAEAVRLLPSDAGAHYNLGFALNSQGQTKDAIAQYAAALQINPAYAQAHNAIGNALVRQGKLQEAIDHFSVALRINPNFAAARTSLSAAQTSLQRAKDAPQAGQTDSGGIR